MYRLIIHDDAKDDLQRLREISTEAAVRIVLMLQEIQGDQDLLDRLSQDNYGHPGFSSFNVCGWKSQWHNNQNLWRLKAWDLEKAGLKYRIIYEFIPKTKHYCVLAVVDRKEFNYESDHPITKRILKAIQDC